MGIGSPPDQSSIIKFLFGGKVNRANPRRTARTAKAEPPPSQPKKKPGRRTTRRKSSTDTVILAMSPKAANVLRVVLTRSRHEEPELRAVQAELEDQLGGFPPRK